MENKSLFGIIAVIVALAVVSISIPSVAAINPTNHIIEEPIRAGEDDGFVTSLLSQGNLVNDSSSISIGQQAEDVFSLKFSAYLRFSNITIPTDAKMSKAYITVVPTFTNRTGPLMKITAANRSNPSAPKNYSDYSTRNKTEASVDWNASYWYEGVSVNSSDISGIIQELVDSYDYSTGTSILIFLDEVDKEIKTKYQAFAAYEHLGYEPAKLYIEYITEKEEEYKVHNINIGKGFPTIQAAIDDPDTQDGNTISVDPGTYFEHLVIDKPLKLIGEDKNTTIIECGRSGKCVHVTADNVEISGFTIQNGTDGILLESSNGCIIDNNIISYHCEGIYLSDSNNNLIAHNSLHNNGYCISGIHLSSSHSNEIRDNDLVENAGSVSLSDSNNNLIYHNNFVDNTEQAYDNTGTNSWDNGPVEGGNYWSDHGCIGNPSDRSQPYTIDTDGVDQYPFQDPSGWLKENQPPSTPTLYDPGTIDTDGKYSVSWSAVSGATSYTLEEDTSSSFSSPTVIHSGAGTSKYITGKSDGTYYYRVKACNASGCSGWSNVEDIKVEIPGGNIITVDASGGADYTTIHEAVDNAGSGFIIKVSPGTYFEHLVIDKPLKLMGEDKNTTIINGSGRFGGNCVNVTADNVEISGFTIQKGSDGVLLESSDGCTISGNMIQDNDYGIRLIDSNNNDITNNILFNNVLYFCGIHLFSSHNNVISDNDLVENGGGVSLSDSNNNLIYHNNFIDNLFEQADDNSGTNSWDNGPSEGGNYWSDHSCIGNPSDEPYYIDSDSVDHYPFQDPNGWLKGVTDGNIITNTIGMEFVLIPAGAFEMGSPSDEEGGLSPEGPVHRVNIEKAFYMGRYEVTQKQWHEILGDNPSYFKGDYLPVETVSWDDVQEFIKKVNEKESTDKYRLPSEAEWEYAARAGSTTRYSFGDLESILGDYAGYNENSGGKTHPIGQKKPNP